MGMLDDLAARMNKRSTETEPPRTQERDAPTAPEQDRAAVAAAAEASDRTERMLASAAAAYRRMVPAIETARPLQPETGDELRGVERIIDGVRRELTPTDPSRYTVDVRVVGDALVATVTCHVQVDRVRLGKFLVGRLAQRGNVGDDFEPHLGAHPSEVILVRRGVTGAGLAWKAHGTRARNFHARRDGQRTVFDLAGLFQTHKTAKIRRYPSVHSFGEDARGGTVELRLPPGMLLERVRKAEPGLRQALNAPDLTVDAAGINPVVRLNTKAVTADFPKANLLRPELFVRPRTMAERHAAASEFVLPLGVRADGSPILISQAVAPSMGIFAAAGMGKTILLEQIVRAAVLQGSEVILVDAKNGKDLRKLALEHLPGVVHYAAGSEAGLHRAVTYVRDEFERRKALAARLQQEGFDYKPTPLLLVFDEAPAWLDDAISGTDKDAKRAAEATIANLAWICSQAREQKCFVLTAGQYAYASAFAGRWKSNTNTLVILGPPSEINRQALFSAGEPRDRVKELAAGLSKTMKGRGIVADVETGEVQVFQGYFNPDGEAADLFNAEVAKAPRLRRFAWRFPTDAEDGGNGAWQSWTPASEPSSDDLPVQYLDSPDGLPDPAATRYDPTSKSYTPGAKPLRQQHLHEESHDRKETR